MPEAVNLARSGGASLLIDAPPNRTPCRDDLALYVNYVVSRRRAVDLAATLPNVDATRIAAGGFSFGAEITATLSGVDHRPDRRLRPQVGPRPPTPASSASSASRSAQRSSSLRREDQRRRPRALGRASDPRRHTHPKRHAGLPDPATRRAGALYRCTKAEGAALVPSRPRPERRSDRVPGAMAASPTAPAKRGGNERRIPRAA